MTSSAHRTWPLGLPFAAIVLLGLLAAPRVVLHDLGIIREGTLVNALLVFVPLIIWIVVAIVAASQPFVALLSAGAVYGLCLAIAHNLFWNIAFSGETPRLGGNLAGRLPSLVEELLLRGAMTLSSLFTGLAIGAICGIVAWGISRIARRSARDS